MIESKLAVNNKSHLDIFSVSSFLNFEKFIGFSMYYEQHSMGMGESQHWGLLWWEWWLIIIVVEESKYKISNHCKYRTIHCLFSLHSIQL